MLYLLIVFFDMRKNEGIGFVIATLMLLGLGCQEEVNTSNVELLEFVEEYSLPLELEALPRARSLQYNPKKNELSFFEQSQTKLYVYDFATRQLKHTFTFAKEGPNGTGNYNRLLGHHYINPDSIYLFNNSTFALMAFSGENRIKQEFRLNGYDNSQLVAFPDVRCLRPLVIVGGKAIIMGVSVGLNPVDNHTKLNQLRLIDLETGEITYTLPRSERYNQGYWGNVMLYQAYYDYNPDTEELVCATGLDHELFIYDLKTGKIRTVDARIEGFPNELKPLRKDKDERVSKEEAKRYEWTTPSYYCILYDTYRKRYYRFATPPLSDEEYLADEPLWPIVAVFDEHFDKVGEYTFPKDLPLKFNVMFVGPEGIYVNTPQLKEGFMSFYIFKPPV